MQTFEVQAELTSKSKHVPAKGSDQWSYKKAPPLNLSIMGVGFAGTSLGLTVGQYFSASWTIQPRFIGSLQTDPESDKIPCDKRTTCADCSANGKCVYCFSAGKGSSCKEGSAAGPEGIVSCPSWSYGAKQCHGFSDKHFGPFITCTSETGADYKCLNHFEAGGTCDLFEKEKEDSGRKSHYCEYMLAGESKLQCEATDQLCGYNGNWVRTFIALTVAASTIALASGLVLMALPFLSSAQLTEEKAKVKEERRLFVQRTKVIN